MKAIFALFVRSLQEEARRGSTYISRTTLVAFILILILTAQSVSRNTAGAAGLAVFGAISMLNLIFITVIGLGFFSSAITEEKEEQTLGLLRMTNLSPLAILLGKSVSRWLGVTLLIVAQFPFTILSVSIGGLTLDQVTAVYVILLCHTFFLSNFCLLFSVVCLRSRTAGALATVSLFMVYYGFRILAGFFETTADFTFGLDSVADFLAPLEPFSETMAVMMPGRTGLFTMEKLTARLLGGVGFFLVSWLVFDRCNREEKEEMPQKQADGSA